MFDLFFVHPTHFSTALLVAAYTLPLGTIPYSLQFLMELSIKLPHPLLATWVEHMTQSPGHSGWFRDGHVPEAGSIGAP